VPYLVFVIVAEEKGVTALPPQPTRPPPLPIYNIGHHISHVESTLLQVLILLDLISFRINTYKKPGGGDPDTFVQ